MIRCLSIADAAGVGKFALSIADADAGGETSGGRSALSIAADGGVTRAIRV